MHPRTKCLEYHGSWHVKASNEHPKGTWATMFPNENDIHRFILIKVLFDSLCKVYVCTKCLECYGSLACPSLQHPFGTWATNNRTRRPLLPTRHTTQLKEKFYSYSCSALRLVGFRSAAAITIKHVL